MSGIPKPRFGAPVSGWLPWFAWKPVRLWHGGYIWLRRIYRRRIQIYDYLHNPGGDDQWWQYSETHDERPPAWAREMLALLKQSARKETEMAKNLDDVLAEVQSLDTVADSVLAILKAGQNDPAKIDQIIAAIEADKSKWQSAVTAGTPNDTTTGGTGTDTTTGASGGDAVTGTPQP